MRPHLAVLIFKYFLATVNCYFQVVETLRVVKDIFVCVYCGTHTRFSESGL